MSLTNVDLEILCKVYKINLIQCTGKDGLIGKPKNGAYIINLNNIHQNGTHWCCFFIKDNYCTYFDSFGCICPYNVSKFLKQSNIHTSYNTDTIQELYDDHCGYYCIAFLFYMTNHKGKLTYLLNKFNAMFNLKDTKKNVGILQEYYKTMAKLL